MKIAILTQPLGHNYGGLLQAYALQRYLKNLGHEVETLDRRRLPSWKGLTKRYVFNFIKLMQGSIQSIPTGVKQAYVLEELIKFRDNKLVMSPTIVTEKALREYYKENHFDIFLVGSDQVWRPRYSPSILNFYLDFLNDIQSASKRIAYAASFGVDNWEYSRRLTKKCKELAQQFDAISVRESSAIDLCRKNLGVDAVNVVDPTLLLDPEEYKLLIDKRVEKKIHPGCVLSFLLDYTEEKKSILNYIGTNLGCDIFSLKPECSVEKVRKESLDKCRFPSVENWLQAFQDAKFVVTDSFHGTVFSILFNKPFIAIGNASRGMARFESVLSQFDLMSRLVLSRDEVNAELIYSPIDWQTVNSKRKELAGIGKYFLEKSIMGC